LKYPFSGWAYTTLTNADSALALANDILTQFLGQTRGGASHQTPKTLAIVDLAKFQTFITAWEAFMDAMLTQMPGDKSLHTFTSRARSSAVAFEGIVDTVGTQNPSALDIGDFMAKLQTLCTPGGDVGTTLLAAQQAYEVMMVNQGNGPRTAAGTGMHITWPNQAEYSSNTALWTQVLFTNSNYKTHIVPKYRAFLEYFLPAGSQGGGGGNGSVCGMGAIPTAAQSVNNPDGLIHEDEFEEVGDGTFTIETIISADVSQMICEYGVDLTTPLGPFLEENGYVPRDDEYLFLMGGDVAGTYDGATFTADWDGNFYFLNISGVEQFEALYVFDQGDGSKKIPTIYFPEETREEVSELGLLDYLFFNFTYWIEKGAKFSFMQFSTDEAEGRVNDNLVLYAATESGGVFTEVPRTARGIITPLVYVDAFIQGYDIGTLPGGFNQTLIDWSEEIEYNILTTPPQNIFTQIPDADAVIMNVYAYNHNDPDAEVEKLTYDVIRPEKGGGIGIDDGDAASINGSGAASLSMGMGLITTAGLLFTGFL
jgi:hypothetical protein